MLISGRARIKTQDPWQNNQYFTHVSTFPKWKSTVKWEVINLSGEVVVEKLLEFSETVRDWLAFAQMSWSLKVTSASGFPIDRSSSSQGLIQYCPCSFS